MGSPDFAVPALKKLASEYRVVAVVTQPDRPSGRGRILQSPPVKLTALERYLPVLQPAKINDPLVLEQMSDLNPDLIVVAAYGQILRKGVLEMAPFGCVNIHASLLPRWRGAAPIQACILAGDERSGVTIMKIDAGVDTGPIINQEAIKIQPEETGGSLFEKLSVLGGKLLMETLPGYLSGDFVPQPQDDLQAKYAPMLKREDGKLEPGEPAGYLARKVRAFNPWPGTFFKLNGKTIKVLAAHDLPGDSKAGEHLVIDGFPAISTVNGSLVLDIVQPSGKKAMSGSAFLSGARDWQIT